MSKKRGTTAIIYGAHPVRAALKHQPLQCLALLHAEGSWSELVTQARRQGIAVETIRLDKLDKLTDGGVHQGVAMRYKPPPPLALGDLQHLDAGRAPLVLALDRVQDPRNLGACLRCADAAGVDAVLLHAHGSAQITPLVRKAACGAAEALRIVMVNNLAQGLERLQRQGFWIVGAADGAATPHDQLDWTGPRVLVMGSEGDGLRELTKKRCDELARIPMAGTVSSLNVSVATGVMLFEAMRQRRPSTSKDRTT